MKKNYAIKASYTTVRELINWLQDMPSDAFISCCGKNEFWVNVNYGDNYITFDEYNLNAYEGLSAIIYDNSKAMGEVFADSQKDDTYSFYCFEDKHEESGFENYGEAVSALLYYCSSEEVE